MTDFFEKFYNKINECGTTGPTKGDQLYCIMDVNFSLKNITPNLLINDEKYSSSYTIKFLKSEIETNIKHSEAIFQYVSGFYIYLMRGIDDSYLMKIIYKPQNYEEIKLYINGLKKLK